jgi:hypothetical protein
MFDRQPKEEPDQQINKRAGPAATTTMPSTAPVRSSATNAREDIRCQSGSNECHNANRHGLS